MVLFSKDPSREVLPAARTDPFTAWTIAWAILEGNMGTEPSNYQAITCLSMPQSSSLASEQETTVRIPRGQPNISRGWDDQLRGRNKTQAINMHAVPVIGYPAGIVGWTMEERDATAILASRPLPIDSDPKSCRDTSEYLCFTVQSSVETSQNILYSAP